MLAATWLKPISTTGRRTTAGILQRILTLAAAGRPSMRTLGVEVIYGRWGKSAGR